jgi:hypothetical protein
VIASDNKSPGAALENVVVQGKVTVSANATVAGNSLN